MSVAYNVKPQRYAGKLIGIESNTNEFLFLLIPERCVHILPVIHIAKVQSLVLLIGWQDCRVKAYIDATCRIVPF